MKYRINYSKVISQVESIEKNVSNLSALIKEVEQIEQDCHAVWKGKAADTFVAKLSTLRIEINRTKNQMSILASTIKYCADKIQEEDRRAEERAKTLSSGH